MLSVVTGASIANSRGAGVRERDDGDDGCIGFDDDSHVPGQTLGIR